MAVALLCFAFAEFVEFILHLLCILFMMVLCKPATAVPKARDEIKKLRMVERYQYLADITCDGEQKEGYVREYLGKNAIPQCQIGTPMQVRYDGENCYFVKPVLKSALRALLIAAACVAGYLLLFLIGPK